MGPTLAYADVLTDLAGSAWTGSGLYTWPWKRGFVLLVCMHVNLRVFFFLSFFRGFFFLFNFLTGNNFFVFT